MSKRADHEAPAPKQLAARRNEYLSELEKVDYLYHLGLDTTMPLKGASQPTPGNRPRAGPGPPRAAAPSCCTS